MNTSIAGSLSSAIKSSPTGLLGILQANGYAIMIPLMIFEGPVTTYVAAFAASLGLFKIYYVFILAFLAAMIGDLIFFNIGRIGKRYVIDKYVAHWLKARRIKKIRRYLKENPGKTIATVKLTPSLPVPGIMLIGASDVPLGKFMLYSAVVSFFYALTMSLLGFYSGIYFTAVIRYVKDIFYLVGAIAVLVVVLYFLLRDAEKLIRDKLESI